ncbi:MAG: hypothetical protein DCC71_06090 [Proteobacteria bacterium]|nr:MAG: hypothetical protein DCC71_06090 [Pseudomonadota bacterium]
MPGAANAGRSGAVLGLAAVGLALMAASFFAPMWWVSLTAPNYPEHMYPDGVRIVLHWDRVANGCGVQQREREEIAEEEPLDCVEEMNVINHYIGMHPIERGARLELAAAPWLFLGFGALVIAGLFYAGPLWWLLWLPAIALPLGFLVDFSGWLYWFGHNLNEWAAFTVKPFMPTVLGEGKVAQFSTYSYPHYGFALSVAASACLALALLRRRKELEVSQAAPAALRQARA